MFNILEISKMLPELQQATATIVDSIKNIERLAEENNRMIRENHSRIRELYAREFAIEPENEND